ncbi:MAG: phage antirepressor Ant [Erysipelotrichia bacterium]|nr:phage antirepressor Ant [Erysipelotrichia bacterium]
MNDIVKIEKVEISGNEVNSVNARELWERLESKQDFSTWIKARIEKFDFVEGEDYIRLHKKMEANNATLVDYIITIDMAKELAMVENNEKGKEVRKYFIEVEKKANRPLTFEEMSKQTIMLADKRIKELEFKIQQDTPKVSYAEAVVGTINPISLREWISSLKSDEGLKVGEREVISFLEEKYLYRDKGDNLRAYAAYAKYFTLIPITKATPKGNREYMQLKVTGLGQLEVGVKVLERFNTKQSA